MILAVAAMTQAFTYTVRLNEVMLEQCLRDPCQVTVGIDETTGHQGVGFDPSTIMPTGKPSIPCRTSRLLSTHSG